MTTPDDSSPLAPRRPLGKPAAAARGGAQAPSPAQPGSAFTSGGPYGVEPPRASTRPAAERSAFNGAAPARASDQRAEDSEVPRQAAPVGARPDPGQPGGRPRTGPTAASGYYAGYAAGSSADIETQPAMPIPPGLAPVPPAPPAAMDKRAERAAARERRRIESRKPRTVRRAKLRVVRVDPWSVTKTAFLLSIAFGIMCVVAVFLVFSIMSASGLWDSVNTTIQGVVDQRPSEAFDIKDYVGMSRVMGITMLISAIDVVIITALATLGAFIYNMSASLLGGIEITLAEDLR